MSPPADGPVDGPADGAAAGEPAARRSGQASGRAARSDRPDRADRQSAGQPTARARSGASAQTSARRASARDSSVRDSSARESGAPVREPLSAAERAARRRSARLRNAEAARGPLGLPQRRTQRRGRSRHEGRPQRGGLTQPRVLTRRRVLARRWAAVSVLLGLVGAALVVFYTPVLGVRNVDVSGAVGLRADQVRSAAAVPPGAPMVRLDTGAVAARVATLARVASVDVFRQWPGTVRIVVTERTPVGVVPAPGGVHLVDGAGVDYATVAATVAPPGLPRIQLPAISPEDPRTQAVVRVLAALPAQLRGRVATVAAQTPGSVQFGLLDGRTVRWGSAEDSARKSAVLAALMTQPGKVFDVSSPDLPTIS